MKRSIILITSIFISYSFFQSCNLNIKRGNGNIEIEETELNDFTKLSIGGNYDVTLIQGNDNKVVIETDENLFRYINVELFDQTLNINNVHNLKGSEGIKVDIYYNTLDKIYSTGASRIEHDDILIADDLSVNLSGAGAIDLEIETSSVKVNLSGAGVIKLSGKTDRQEVHITGAGGLDAMELISNECNINLSGLGGAEVYAVEKLEATITGIGGIIYGGNPKLIEQQITGLGKIKRAEEFIEEENI